MFEGFPYTNFHELNLDWIIKIAKDFLDQYTNIQQTITQGLEDLDTKAEQLQALLDAWYEEHSQDIADQLADALQDLNTWYTEHQGYLDQYLTDSIAAFGLAADAKAAETLASIPADYSAVAADAMAIGSSGEPYINASTIVTGYEINTNGSNHQRADSCRSAMIPINGIIRITLENPDYIFNVWRYSGTTVSTVVDMLKTEYNDQPVIVKKTGTAVNFRFAVHKVDGTAFTDSDTTAVMASIKFIIIDDYTLENHNAAADAGAIAKVLEYNSKKLSPSVRDVAETTSTGITYSITNDVASFEGTSTGAFLVNLYGSVSSISDWLKSNTKYFVNIEKSNPGDDIRIRINTYDSEGQSIGTLYNSGNNGTFTTPDLSQVAGLIIRWYIPANRTVNSTAKVDILNALTNKQLSDGSTEFKIRLMQYNMGKLNMGDLLDSDTRFLTTDNYPDILLNYKNMFGKYQPDIIGAEEFEGIRDIYDPTGTTVVETANLYTDLYYRLYPNVETEEQAIISKLALLSKYPIRDSRRVSFRFYYYWEGVEKSDLGRVRISHVNIANKTVCFAVTAMTQAVDDEPREEGIVKRQAMIPYVLDLLESEEYAFVIADVNNGGTVPGYAASVAEGNDIYNDILVDRGYKTVNGNYYPWQVTYISASNVSRVSAIDNIWYKDNGKIVMSGFQVLNEYYNAQENKLASDHIPIIADFVLL